MKQRVKEPGIRTEGDKKLRVVGILCAVIRASDETSVGEPQSRMYLVFERFCRADPRVSTNIEGMRQYMPP